MLRRFFAGILAAPLIFSVSCASAVNTQPVAEQATANQNAAPSSEAAVPSSEAAVSGLGAAVGGQLNLFTWEGMFPQAILDSFEADRGIKINYVNFDTDETMLAKLQTAQGGDYDLVIADDYIIQTAIASNLAQKLDKSKLANYGNINKIYQGQFFDPNNEYTVPYGAGVLTLMYDPSAVSADIQSYSDLWDPSLKGSVGLIANYRVIDGVALKVLGESFNTENLDTIQKAGDKLIELAPNIRLIKDDDLQSDLLSGEIFAGIFYTSQATQAKLQKPDLKIVFPKEGIGFGIMAGFIPSKAPNPGAAYAFLDYIMDPQRGADCFEFLGYYSTFSASDPLIKPEYKEFLTLPEGFNVNMEMIENISAQANEKHEQIWTAFKTAAGAE